MIGNLVRIWIFKIEFQGNRDTFVGTIRINFDEKEIFCLLSTHRGIFKYRDEVSLRKFRRSRSRIIQVQERTCALRTRRNEWTIIGETSENAGHSFPSACRSRHKYRSNTRTCTCMRTDRAPTPLLLAPLLMRFVRLRQVLRGRAPR